MPVDLSGTIYDQYLKACQRAKDAARHGKSSEVAAAYRQAAELMRQLAEYTRDPNVRKQRLEKAKQYDKAANIKSSSSKTSDRKKSVPRSEIKETGDEEADEFEAEVMSMILQTKLNWKDIGGLDDTKKLIKSAYVMALAKKPKGIYMSKLNNLLMYGPPGTGKTLLAAATAGNIEATFFNVKVSNLLSKYFGESTKLISALYSVARKLNPSVIFLDEFEALTPHRDGAESGAERRIVSTLLAELDGLSSKQDPQFVMTMVATNLPWALDTAILSRFQQRIYVPLPDKSARKSILSILIDKQGYQSDIAIPELVSRSEGFSGRDLEQLCTMAITHMVQSQNPDMVSVADKGLEEVRNYEIDVCSLSEEDFKFAFSMVKPVTNEKYLMDYKNWSTMVNE